MSDRPASEAEVLFSKRGRLAQITLNRPRAINALGHGMVKQIHAQLDKWALDDEVQTVAITGAGERGLCAGGDIVSLYRSIKAGDIAEAAKFWADEFRLNLAIANYPKPFVAIMHGVVFGGGIGLSAHGSHRVVTDSSKLAMPETTIGYVPDVGGTWLLSRAAGELGTYLALTGEAIGAADAIALGLADSFIASGELPGLLVALEVEPVETAIASFAAAPPAPELVAERDWIDPVFGSSSVGEIMAKLRKLDTPRARDTVALLEAKSPTSLVVTLEALRLARELESLEQALTQEYRVSSRLLITPDFIEGVRAQVIDKDRNPDGQPAEIERVSAASVAAFFERPLSGDLSFETPDKG